MSSSKVLIVGGGLGGLALAQGLKQAKIAFRVFERDAAAGFRAQGYRIRIDQNGADALRTLLPSDLYDLFEKTSSTVIKGGQRVDAATGAIENGGMPNPPGASWNVDRTVLRQVLLSGLDEHVEFGKRLERYSVEPEGARVHFADGTTHTGKLLVGADGINSIVRRQLDPAFVVLDTTGRAVFGKTAFSALKTEPSPPTEVLTGGISVIAQESAPGMLFCDTMRFDHTLPPSISASIKLPEDYLYWVLLFQTKTSPIPAEQLPTLSTSQSAALAQDITSKWHPSIAAITANQIPDAASTLSFYLAKPPISDREPSPHATLLGDAAHPMPPVGGVGANAAFQDASDLAVALKNLGGSEEEREVDVEALRVYEAKVRDRANQGAEKIVKGAGRFLGTPPVEEMKPVEW